MSWFLFGLALVFFCWLYVCFFMRTGVDDDDDTLRPA